MEPSFPFGLRRVVSNTLFLTCLNPTITFGGILIFCDRVWNQKNKRWIGTQLKPFHSICYIMIIIKWFVSKREWYAIILWFPTKESVKIKSLPIRSGKRRWNQLWMQMRWQGETGTMNEVTIGLSTTRLHPLVL